MGILEIVVDGRLAVVLLAHEGLTDFHIVAIGGQVVEFDGFPIGFVPRGTDDDGQLGTRTIRYGKCSEA